MNDSTTGKQAKLGACSWWNAQNLTLAIVTIAVSLATVAVAAVPLYVNARFGPIDDHTYAGWLGRDGHLSLPEAWQAFLASEVSRFGQTPRWRPVYWAVQLSETLMWQDFALPRYVTRALLLIAVSSSQAFLLVLLTRKIEIVAQMSGDEGAPRASIGTRCELTLGGLAAFWFAGMYTWSDILTRLGPSELFAAVGTALVTVGFYRVVAGLPYAWGWLPIGFAVAVLSKENFLVLAVPIAALALGVLFTRKSLPWAAYLSLGMCALVLTLVVLAVGPAYAGSGDVYGSQRGLTSTLITLVDAPDRLGLFALCVVLWFSVVGGLAALTNSQNRKGLLGWGALVGGCGVVVLASEFVVYGLAGNQPRYLWLTEFTVTWLAAFFAASGVVIYRGLRYRGYRTWSSVLQVMTVMTMFLLSLATGVFVLATLARASDNAARADKLFAQFAELKAVSEAAPRFVLVASSAGEYESVISLSRYLAWQIPDSRLALLYKGTGDQALDADLTRMQSFGSEDGALVSLQSLRGEPFQCLILDPDSVDVDAFCSHAVPYVLQCESIGLRPISNWVRPLGSRHCILPSGRKILLAAG